MVQVREAPCDGARCDGASGQGREAPWREGKGGSPMVQVREAG
jgi:hypothetical protein